MKKTLLSALALCAGLTTMAQGINDVAAYDDFSDVAPSMETEEVQIDLTDPQNPTCLEEVAYKGLFTYGNKDFATDGFGLNVTRNSTDKRLEVEIDQDKGAYEPFGFIFGSYCVANAEEQFTLDLSNNAVTEFTITVNDYTNLEEAGDGSPAGSEGVQIKLQLTDANGVTLAFDKAAVEEGAGGAYLYEIGVTGGEPNQLVDGANDFNGVNYAVTGDEITIRYDWKNAVPANDKVDAPATDGRTFDYSQVESFKITFANNVKDATDDLYHPYRHQGTYYISDIEIGDISTLTSILKPVSFENQFEAYPNPATENVTFGKTLTNVSVYNAQGMLVETLPSANSLNVSSYSEGVYLIKATEGTSRILVK